MSENDGNNNGGNIILEQLLEQANLISSVPKNRLAGVSTKSTQKEHSIPAVKTQEIKETVDGYTNQRDMWECGIKEADVALVDYVQKYMQPIYKEVIDKVQMPVEKSWKNLWHLLQYLGLVQWTRIVDVKKNVEKKPDIQSALPKLKERLYKCADILDDSQKNMEGLIGKIVIVGEKTKGYRDKALENELSAIKYYAEVNGKLEKAKEILSGLYDARKGMRKDNPDFGKLESQISSLDVMVLDYQGEVIRTVKKAENAETRIKAMRLYEKMMKGLEVSTKIVRDYTIDTVETTRQFLEVSDNITPLTDLIRSSVVISVEASKHLDTLTKYVVKVSNYGITPPIPTTTPLDLDKMEKEFDATQKILDKRVGEGRTAMDELIYNNGGNGKYAK